MNGSDALVVMMNGVRAAVIHHGGNGLEFRYDDDYMDSDAPPLSLSLAFSHRPYIGGEPDRWIAAAPRRLARARKVVPPSASSGTHSIRTPVDERGSRLRWRCSVLPVGLRRRTLGASKRASFAQRRRRPRRDSADYEQPGCVDARRCGAVLQPRWLSIESGVASNGGSMGSAVRQYADHAHLETPCRGGGNGCYRRALVPRGCSPTRHSRRRIVDRELRD